MVAVEVTYVDGWMRKCRKKVGWVPTFTWRFVDVCYREVANLHNVAKGS